MNTHMENVHNESDNMRRVRLEQTIEAAVNKASPLETVVETVEEKSETEDEDAEEHVEEFEDFKVVETPQKAKSENKDGFSFRGVSDSYKDAQSILSKMMSKKCSRYRYQGREIHIESVPKAAPITVEVTTIKGETGEAGLMFYESSGTIVCLY